MTNESEPPFEAFIPSLVWPGRRPALSELATWHEALRDAVGQHLPLDLLACWLLPSRGGQVLVGPAQLAGDNLIVPPAEPLVQQEALFALEDRVRRGGYGSVMAVPIRSEVQDVGILLAASFHNDQYGLEQQRVLHRSAAMVAGQCRRLAALPWVTPAAPADDRNAVIAGLAESLLDATDRARTGADLVHLVSDALSRQLPHDRLELAAVAPAPERWAVLSDDGTPGSLTALAPRHLDRVEALVHRLGSRETMRFDNLAGNGLIFPATDGDRQAQRQQSLLAARLEIGGEMVGWIWLGQDSSDWFSDADEDTLRFVARILAARVANWAARNELSGAWG